jgi:hypothetical protein
MMLNGYGGKSQAAINRAYEGYDDDFPQADVVARRFRRILDAIDELLGAHLSQTPFRTENWFIPLCFVVYGVLWGNVPVDKDIGPKRLPQGLGRGLQKAAKQLSDVERLPREVREAITGAATDVARRRARFDYLSQLVS